MLERTPLSRTRAHLVKLKPQHSDPKSNALMQLGFTLINCARGALLSIGLHRGSEASQMSAEIGHLAAIEQPDEVHATDTSKVE